MADRSVVVRLKAEVAGFKAAMADGSWVLPGLDILSMPWLQFMLLSVTESLISVSNSPVGVVASITAQ